MEVYGEHVVKRIYYAVQKKEQRNARKIPEF